MRTLGVGLAVVLLLAGCGFVRRVAFMEPITAGCLRPGFDYGAPRPAAPTPVRLDAARGCLSSHLGVVEPGVSPAVSGSAAFVACRRCTTATNISEELVRYDGPVVTAKPGCSPPASDPRPCYPTNRVTHRLMWFFAFKGECLRTPATASPSPSPDASCPTWTLVDANTGSQAWSMSVTAG